MATSSGAKFANDQVIRIAMWSGPRNISTAMMRAWENRADTQVVDEPFYACFLTATGTVHPMQQEVLASQSSDWQTVIDDALYTALPSDSTIQYQKHMTQHMVRDVNPAWFASLRHAFLIRSPQEVVASYGEKRNAVNADDVGFVRQLELYQQALAVSDRSIPIIDAQDVLQNPRQALTALCSALDVPFDSAMLNWPAGRRSSDGVWAPHWYHNVEASTGFAPYRKKLLNLSAQDQKVVDQCTPAYEYLHARRLTW